LGRNSVFHNTPFVKLINAHNKKTRNVKPNYHVISIGHAAVRRSFGKMKTIRLQRLSGPELRETIQPCASQHSGMRGIQLRQYQRYRRRTSHQCQFDLARCSKRWHGICRYMGCRSCPRVSPFATAPRKQSEMALDQTVRNQQDHQKLRPKICQRLFKWQHSRTDFRLPLLAPLFSSPPIRSPALSTFFTPKVTS